MNLFKFIAGIFEPAAALIDELHTSDEEKLVLKAKMLEIQAGVMERSIDLEKLSLQAQSSIIEAEIRSDSWLTKNWRPVTMLALVVAVLGYWFGLTPDTLTPEAVDSMFTLVQIGIGGYVVGRSAEKAVNALKK